MSREFILRNQIVERYLSGRLPLKGARDFERYIEAHPQVLDELGVAERVSRALQLLESGGKPMPWDPPKRKLWEGPAVPVGLGVAVLALAVAAALLATRLSNREHDVAALQQRVIEQPIEPAKTTRSIRLLPGTAGPSESPAIVIGGQDAEFGEFRIDMSRSSFNAFRVTIERMGQGRVAVIHNLEKDSNGHLRITLNSSAFGPGNYLFSIEGLTWRGDPVPDAWVTVGVTR
jgi:hypothetical protein